MSKTVDEILKEHGAEEGEFTYSLKAALQALVEEALNEVIGEDELAVMGRGVPGYQQNLLRASQRSLIPQVISKMFGDTK